MIRRLDPMDRVRELGDASVPFRHDVHAMVFSDDAVGQETHLHHQLADRRLNLVNMRREFFRARPPTGATSSPAWTPPSSNGSMNPKPSNGGKASRHAASQFYRRETVVAAPGLRLLASGSLAVVLLVVCMVRRGSLAAGSRQGLGSAPRTIPRLDRPTRARRFRRTLTQSADLARAVRRRHTGRADDCPQFRLTKMVAPPE